MKTKLDIILLIMFLCGIMIFLLPIWGQIQEVKEDEQEFTVMLEQFSPTVADTADVVPEHDDSVVEAASETATPDMSVMLPVLVEVPQSAEPDAASDDPESGSAPDAEHDSDASTDVVPTVTRAPTTTNFDACLEQNKDFVAWLKIPGTPIDYPVVSSNNSEYYLHHLFNGKESKLGCLFSLKSSDYDTPSRNIAIYGHHLSNSDAMFSSLIKYKDSGYYARHSLIQLKTISDIRTYRIFAVLNIKVSDWDPATSAFVDNESFLRFVNRAIEKSKYDTGVDVDANDNILTLITCDRSYYGASGRLVVLAVQE